MNKPKLLRFFLVTALLALSGCFEESSSPSAPVVPSFTEFQPAMSMDKVALDAYPGDTAPIFLTMRGLLTGVPGFQTTILGTSNTLGLQNRFVPWPDWNTGHQKPWVDSEVWVDGLTDQPVISFRWLRDASFTTLPLRQCQDLPTWLVAEALEDRKNFLGGGATHRSGKFIFAFAGGLGEDAGYIVMRVDPRLVGPGIAECSSPGVKDQLFTIPTRWVPLNTGLAPGLRAYETTHLSSIPVAGGILAHYRQMIFDTTQGIPGTSVADVSRLSFIDTNGVETVLDSSNNMAGVNTRFDYVKLFNFRGESYVGARQGLVGIDVAARSVQMVRTGTLFQPPFHNLNYGTAEVQDKLIIFGYHEIVASDMTAWTVQHLSLAGLDSNFITGVVQNGDSVYVSTLSGIFIKPVAKFFEAQ